MTQRRTIQNQHHNQSLLYAEMSAQSSCTAVPRDAYPCQEILRRAEAWLPAAGAADGSSGPSSSSSSASASSGADAAAPAGEAKEARGGASGSSGASSGAGGDSGSGAGADDSGARAEAPKDTAPEQHGSSAKEAQADLPDVYSPPVAPNAATAIVTRISRQGAAAHASKVLIDTHPAGHGGPSAPSCFRSMSAGATARLQGQVTSHWPLDHRGMVGVGKDGRKRVLAVLTIADESGAADVVLAGRAACRFFELPEPGTGPARAGGASSSSAEIPTGASSEWEAACHAKIDEVMRQLYDDGMRRNFVDVLVRRAIDAGPGGHAAGGSGSVYSPVQGLLVDGRFVGRT